jgi:hypothetical protein
MSYSFQLIDAMAGAGMVPKNTSKVTNAPLNKWVRFSCVGDKSGTLDAYLFLNDPWRGVFGHYRLGIKQTFKFKKDERINEPKPKRSKNGIERGWGKESTPVEFAIIDAQKQAKNLDAIEAKTRELFNQSSPRYEHHPYLRVIKQFSSTDLMKLTWFSTKNEGILPRVSGDRLLLPIVNKDGRLMSFQRIAPDGKKRMMSGGIVKGHFIPVTDVFRAKDESIIVITEGYASGVAVKLLYPECHVVAALFAGNLLPVGLNIREKFPFANLIYACDYDGARVALPGEPTGNIGLLKARDAAFMTRANLLIPPVDAQNPNQNIDWWDIWARKRGTIGN